MRGLRCLLSVLCSRYSALAASYPHFNSSHTELVRSRSPLRRSSVPRVSRGAPGRSGSDKAFRACSKRSLRIRAASTVATDPTTRRGAPLVASRSEASRHISLPNASRAACRATAGGREGRDTLRASESLSSSPVFPLLRMNAIHRIVGSRMRIMHIALMVGAQRDCVRSLCIYEVSREWDTEARPHAWLMARSWLPSALFTSGSAEHTSRSARSGLGLAQLSAWHALRQSPETHKKHQLLHE